MPKSQAEKEKVILEGVRRTVLGKQGASSLRREGWVPAVERIKASAIEEVVVTNSIPVPAEKLAARVTVLSVAPLLGEAIRQIHDAGSVSTLFV